MSQIVYCLGRKNSIGNKVEIVHIATSLSPFPYEFPEFGSRVLRQPMENKVVTISRVQGTMTFSANFQLVAAMNPYPCG